MGQCLELAKKGPREAGGEKGDSFQVSARRNDAEDDSPASPKNVDANVSSKRVNNREAELGLPADQDAKQRGCYLIFTPVSSGTLIAQWSETPVEGAWAYFYPRATVAGFKYKQNGGKTELIRDIGVTKTKLFNGWGQFMKLAYDNDGVFMVKSHENEQAEHWYLNNKQEVKQINADEWYEAKDMSVVAIIPKHNLSFNGVQKTDENRFIDTAKAASGYSWKPMR